MSFVERDSDHRVFPLNSIRKFSSLLRNALCMYKARNLLGYLCSLELFLMSTLTDQTAGHLNLSEDAMETAFVILALKKFLGHSQHANTNT